MKKMRLRTLRADHEPKRSQSHTAVAAGMGLYRYWQIENGEGPAPSPAEREAIAAAFTVKVTDIEWPKVARRAVAS